MHRKLLLCGKLAIAVALIFFLVHSGRFDVAVYANLLESGRLMAMGGVAAVQTSMLLLQLTRWWILLRALNTPLSFAESLRVGLMGSFANLFVPGGLGIDGSRLLYFRRHCPAQMTAAVWSVVLDRLLGVTALVLVAMACGVYLAATGNAAGGTPHLFKFLWSWGVPSVSAVGLVGWATARRIHRCARRGRFRRAGAVLAMAQEQRRALAVAFAISAVGHVGNGVTALIGLWALGLEAAPIAVLAVTPLVTLCSAIPLTPFGLGVTEGVAAFLYPAAGLQGGAELQLLLRASRTLLALFFGLAYFQTPQTSTGKTRIAQSAATAAEATK